MKLYSKNHIWVETRNDTASLGLTVYAVEKLKSVMFVNLPDEGDHLEIGKAFGDVESVKTVADLISPVTGTVLEVNQDLVDDPEDINESPENVWLINVADAVPDDDLMTNEEYDKYLETIE